MEYKHIGIYKMTKQFTKYLFNFKGGIYIGG